MSTPLVEAQVFGTRLAGGVATAEMLPDGQVIVRDVPLFAEIRPTDPGARDGTRTPRDRSWIERAAAKTVERIAKVGKRPIMTLRHYFDDPERVGTYEPTKVEVAEVNPGEEPRAVVFGNKLYENVQAFEKGKDYDFRSIEISPDSPDEFSALALLRDKEPYHKFPNLRERLAKADPAIAQAFEQDTFRALASSQLQVWRGRPEVFATYQDHQSQKEGTMPAPETETKPQSLEERMEAMASKCFEGISKKFESMFEAAVKKTMSGGKADEPAKPEAAQEKKPEEKKEEPKTEAASATGPNGNLPPAVSQTRPPATPAVPEAFSAQIATQAQTILGLQERVQKMEREKAATAIVGGARKTLLDLGCSSVSEAFEQAAFKAACEHGQEGVNRLLENVKLGMGLGGSRGPEAFGAMTGPASSAAAGAVDDLKKAIDTYASRPENASRIPVIQGMHRDWMQTPEGFRRGFKDGFSDLLRGDPRVNEGWAEGKVIRG